MFIFVLREKSFINTDGNIADFMNQQNTEE